MRPDDTAPDGAVLIPLYARNGSVRGYAIVDAPDAAWVNQWTWHLDGSGYARRSTGQSRGPAPDFRAYLLHRELMAVSEDDTLTVDHIDRDRLNNRRSNLRVITRAANAQNVPSHQGTASSFRGVYWDKDARKWRASVRVNGRLIDLGRFHSEIEAASAARAARERLLPYAID